VAVPDGTSDYEVRTTTLFANGYTNVVTYLRATTDALHSDSTLQGTYYAAVLSVAHNVPNPATSGTLTLFSRVGGTLTQLASTTVPFKSLTEVRASIIGSTILVYVHGTRYLSVQNTAITTGQPGLGGYGFTGYSGIVQRQLGPADRIAPPAPLSSSVFTTALSNSVDIQWGGAADDANGSGVYSYQVFRNSVYVAEVQGTSFTDGAVSPSTSYTYTVKSVDRHGNVGSPVTLAVTTAPSGSIEPRRVGIRAEGSYYGGAGEQLDMRSGNLNYSLPLISAQGRGGWSLPLGLSYNSQNWRKDSATWRFGRDVGYGFGWRLMAGAITPIYSDALTVHHYIFTDSTGAEYRLDVNSSGVWTSSQGTYMNYVEATNRIYFNNGSWWQMDCVSGGVEEDAGSRYPTKVQDSNGNFIVLRYATGVDSIYENSSARILQIEDVRVSNGASTFTFTYNTDTIPHLTGIANSISTAETYTFTYTTPATLYSPFSGGGSFGTAQMLQTVTQTGTSLAHTFDYGGNGAGELAKVTLPYQGELRWLYNEFAFSGSRSVREVYQRQVVKQSGATQWTYTISHPSGDSGYSARSQATLDDASGIGQRVWNFGTATGLTNGLVTSYEQRHTPGPVTKRKQDYTWVQDSNGRPYIGTVLVTIDPGQSYQKQSKTEQTLDVFGNLTLRKEYAFGNLVTPAKTYTNTYSTTVPHQIYYIRNRLWNSQVTDGVSTVTLVSNQYDAYDGYTTLTSLPSTPQQFDSTKTTSFTSRGNPTHVNLPSRTLKYSYDVTGTVTRVADVAGRYVDVASTSATDYARPATVTPNGDGTLTDTMSWSSHLGLTQETGPNGETATVTYDSNARPTTTTSPHGAVTTYTYTNVPPTVKAETNGHWTKSTMDGLGRTIKVERGDGFGTKSIVDTEYEPCACSPLGKTKRVSNPYAPGGTIYWTTYTYDGLGRTVSVSLPNGSGTSTYLYEGNAVTVTSPASKWRKYESDAFGNVSKTIEPNPAGGANLETTFSYNLVGQRAQVQMTRGSVTQTRTWNFSPTTLLLMSETQPESGTTSYYYDYFGRLQSVTKANGGSVTYGRDALGRLSSVADTANVCSSSYYAYGSSLGSYGRLRTVVWGAGCGTGFSEEYLYSVSGLVTSKIVAVSPGGYVTLGYTYNNEGQVTGQSRAANGGSLVWTYYGYDSLGRPSSMTGNSSVSNVTYNPADQLLTMTHGGVQETRQYNERLQLTRITVPGQMDLEYRYSATQNDGNITSMKNNINGEEVNYSYDALNRLSSAVTTGTEWGLSFSYDGFGNKTGQTVTKGTAPGMSIAVDANNRVVGATYDGAGNTTVVNGTTMTWDAQGRMATAGSDTYSYNPSNQRVYKNGKLFVRGIDGKVVAIYDTSGGFTMVNAWEYFRGRKVGQKEDRLGTVQNGSRFYPYGEEHPATAQEKDKFATYWRDSTGFDYAMNRYYMSAHGRFLSPDPYPGSASAGRSGSWNRYAYTEGNPVNRTDPTGLFMSMKDLEAQSEAYNREVDRTQGPGGGDSGASLGSMMPSVNTTETLSDPGIGAGYYPPDAIVQLPSAILTTGQSALPVFSVVSQPAYPSAVNLIADLVVSGSGCVADPACFAQIAGASILSGTGIGASMYYGLIGGSTITTLGSAGAFGAANQLIGAGTRINIGGEGEIAGAINVNLPHIFSPGWGSSASGASLSQLQNQGAQFVIASNNALPFANQSVATVYTNNVPVFGQVVTGQTIPYSNYVGVTVQPSEIWRVLQPGGAWINNGSIMPHP
jgi:RHS repeat-associated protein